LKQRLESLSPFQRPGVGIGIDVEELAHLEHGPLLLQHVGVGLVIENG